MYNIHDDDDIDDNVSIVWNPPKGKNVHSSCIHNSPKLETAQKSVNRMDTLTTVHEKAQTQTQAATQRPPGHYTGWKKGDTNNLMHIKS